VAESGRGVLLGGHVVFGKRYVLNYIYTTYSAQRLCRKHHSILLYTCKPARTSHTAFPLLNFFSITPLPTVYPFVENSFERKNGVVSYTSYSFACGCFQ
jgi:hypothetical protein